MINKNRKCKKITAIHNIFPVFSQICCSSLFQIQKNVNSVKQPIRLLQYANQNVMSQVKLFPHVATVTLFPKRQVFEVTLERNTQS